MAIKDYERACCVFSFVASLGFLVQSKCYWSHSITYEPELQGLRIHILLTASSFRKASGVIWHLQNFDSREIKNNEGIIELDRLEKANSGHIRLYLNGLTYLMNPQPCMINAHTLISEKCRYGQIITFQSTSMGEIMCSSNVFEDRYFATPHRKYAYESAIAKWTLVSHHSFLSSQPCSNKSPEALA